MLDREVRRSLRGLTKENAERVGLHLVMAGRLLDVDPELAYEHAQAAGRRAARIDVVREAMALTAYATGRYAETLREIRTARRLSGVDGHRALEADAERGLGRPERAIAIVREAAGKVTTAESIELTIVEAGARIDMGEAEVALLLLDELTVPARFGELAARVEAAKEPALRALGRADEADAVAAATEDVGVIEVDEDVEVFDLDESEDADGDQIDDVDASEDESDEVFEPVAVSADEPDDASGVAGEPDEADDSAGEPDDTTDADDELHSADSASDLADAPVEVLEVDEESEDVPDDVDISVAPGTDDPDPVEAQATEDVPESADVSAEGPVTEDEEGRLF